jgi:putative hydrolase of the HAD superfamily
MLMRDLVLIFDFGNVVGFFDHGRSFEHFARTLGLDARQLRERVRQRGGIELLRQFEYGRITPDDFARQLMKIGEFELPYAEFVRGWVEIFWLNESVALLIDQLKARSYKLILGSNTNVLHSNHYRRQFARTLGQFDRMVFSYDVGSMKPERKFYDACVRAAGAPAASCVFIDDMRENVEGARRAGLVAVPYTGTPELEAALRSLGVDLAASD